MQIYLEEILFTNCILMMSLLIIISKFFKFYILKFRLILSSIFYGVTSCLVCVWNIKTFDVFIMQLLVTLFAISFSFKKLQPKKILQSLILFFILSNSYTSIMSTIFKQRYIFSTLIFSPINFCLTIIIFIIINFLFSKIIDLILKKKTLNSNIVKGEIIFNNKKILTRCFLDTGHNFCVENKPVSFINYELFHKLTNLNLEDILNGQNNQYIIVNTVAGKQKLIKLELNNLNLKINNKLINNPIFALSLKLNNNYEIILNNSYF